MFKADCKFKLAMFCFNFMCKKNYNLRNMSQQSAALVLISYNANRLALARDACNKARSLSSYRKKINSTTDVQLVQSYQQIVSDLTSEISSIRANIRNLNKDKTAADVLIKTSIPYTPPSNPKPYVGSQGPTGPTGPTVTLPVDSSPQLSSSSLVTSGGVYQRCLDVTVGAVSSVLLGTEQGGDSTVVLLCHFNAQLYSNYSVVESGYYSFTYPYIRLCNSAHLSPNTCKFGTTSLYCTGNSDCLRVDTNDLPTLGVDDFTIEVWVNFEVLRSTDQYVVDIGSKLSVFLTANGSAVSVSVCNVSQSWSYAFNTNTWYNFTVVRSAGTVSVFIDGSLVGTNSQMSDFVEKSIVVVGNSVKDISSYIQGYIDELRISYGIARYNRNFTCQSSEFPDAFTLPLPVVSTGQVWTNGKQLLLKTSTGWKRARLQE